MSAFTDAIFNAIESAIEEEKDSKRIEGCPLTKTKKRRFVFTFQVPSLCAKAKIDPVSVDWSLFPSMLVIPVIFSRRFDSVNCHGMATLKDSTVISFRFVNERFFCANPTVAEENVIEQNENALVGSQCEDMLVSLLGCSGLSKHTLAIVKVLELATLHRNHHITAAKLDTLETMRVIRPSMNKAIESLVEELIGMHAMLNDLETDISVSRPKWNAAMDDYYTKQKLSKTNEKEKADATPMEEVE